MCEIWYMMPIIREAQQFPNCSYSVALVVAVSVTIKEKYSYQSEVLKDYRNISKGIMLFHILLFSLNT